MDSLQLAYLAGFFDGEGNVGLYTGGGAGRTLRAQITQNQKPGADALLSQLRAEWGGSMSAMNRTLQRPAWNWQVSGANAVAFLRAIRPYVSLKAQQLDLAIHWFTSRPGPRRDPATGRMLATPPEQRLFDEKCADILVQLKKSDATSLLRIDETVRHILHAGKAGA